MPELNVPHFAFRCSFLFRRIVLGGKRTLEIPISFAPTEMRIYSTVCCVALAKFDPDSGQPWAEGRTNIFWQTAIKVCIIITPPP